MICLQTALIHMFPEANLPDAYGSGGDWKIASNGKEAEIIEWNRDDQKPSYIELEKAYKEAVTKSIELQRIQIEREWRDVNLSKVLSRIDQYEKDQNYPENLRTSPIQSHDDFLLLLNDRKVLSDYPSAIDFPFGERPLLSGLAE